MSFNDDEQIVSIQNASSPAGTEDEFTVGKAKLKIINTAKAPLDQTELRVLLELTGVGDAKERPGLDLVTVLDVSGSMEGERLDKLKKAMEFVIKKLSPIDRLSLVTFSGNAKRLCPLRVVSDKSRTEIIDMVKGINAGGPTNITDGLERALQILKGRNFTDGRSAGVMLMSDGEQNRGGDAAQVQVGNVPVYTFGFGKGGRNPKAMADVLNGIAKNSKGGTFSDVQNINDLSVAFAQCLAGLLTVAVQDLKLIISSPEGKKVAGKAPEKNSQIQKVFAGDYDQSPDNDSGVSVAFGNLYDKETRKIIVDLILPMVPKEVSTRVLKIGYTYSNKEGLEKKSNPVFASVKRSGKFTKEEKEEVIVEGSRLETARMMKEARIMADNNNLNGAQNKLVDAQNMLEDVEIDEANNAIEMLKAELQQLLIFMQTPDLYKNSGRPFALSSELSHERQRFAARGDPEKLRLFSTPRMDAYSEQAKSFDKDPTKPVPTAEEDVKEEILADPLGPISGALSFHLQAAIQALQAIESIINASAR